MDLTASLRRADPSSRGKRGQSSGSHPLLCTMVALRCAVVLAALLMSSVASARRSLSVVADPSAISSAEALSAFSQWSGMQRRSLTSAANSPTGATDMRPCPSNNGYDSWYWTAASNLFLSVSGESACACLPSYIPSYFTKELDFGTDLHLALYGTLQQPTQLQYTIGDQTFGWDLTAKVPAIVSTEKLATPLATNMLAHPSATVTQCDLNSVQQQCGAMCTGMSTQFHPLCPNGAMTYGASESVVCGFTQMSGSSSKCLDACKAVQCVH